MNEIVTILYHPYVLGASNVLACILFRCIGTVVAEHVKHGFATWTLQIGGESPYIFLKIKKSRGTLLLFKKHCVHK